MTNNLDEPASVPWHGLILPPDQDGVPGFSFDGMAAGETFTYRFPIGQADGNNGQPVVVDELRIAVAETYDMIVRPSEDRAYTIFAESMGRTADARGRVAPREGMQAETPSCGSRRG